VTQTRLNNIVREEEINDERSTEDGRRCRADPDSGIRGGLWVGFDLAGPVLAADPDQYVAFLVDNLTLMHIWHLIIYLVAGVFLVVLVLALHERLKGGSPAMAQTAAAFGLIWAGLVDASGMLLINDAGVVALG
jgi:hypothetical protein